MVHGLRPVGPRHPIAAGANVEKRARRLGSAIRYGGHLLFASLCRVGAFRPRGTRQRAETPPAAHVGHDHGDGGDGDYQAARARSGATQPFASVAEFLRRPKTSAFAAAAVEEAGFSASAGRWSSP